MHPVLFEIPILHRPVYAYGTMLYLSFVVGWSLSRGLAARDGLARRAVEACFLVTAVCALAGSRLLFVITNPGLFHRALDVFDVSSGGVVAYGGFLGGLAGSLVYCRLRGLPVLAWADCAVPCLCTGLAITRVGCFMAGCDFGVPWAGPWAVSFPHGAPAFAQHVAQGLVAPGALWSLPVHPTQIYESLAGAVLLTLVIAARRRRRVPGEALAAFTIGYAVLRYAIETLRADPQRGFVGPFSTSQFLALVTCVAGIALFARLRASAPGSPGRPQAR